jgi:hypothetical protein
MGCDGVEVAAQTITGDGGYTVIVQTQMEIVEEGIGVLLLSSAQMKQLNDLGHRVYGKQSHCTPVRTSAYNLSTWTKVRTKPWK